MFSVFCSLILLLQGQRTSRSRIPEKDLQAIQSRRGHKKKKKKKKKSEIVAATRREAEVVAYIFATWRGGILKYRRKS